LIVPHSGFKAAKIVQYQNLNIMGSRFFGFFGIFNFLQFAIDGENSSKTKVEKVFFFIFMSSYAEMSFVK
jgi:hypothetical protein